MSTYLHLPKLTPIAPETEIEPLRATCRDAYLAEALERARLLPPMTDDERREQAAGFAYGQLAMTKEWEDATPEALERLRARCRELAGCPTTGPYAPGTLP